MAIARDCCGGVGAQSDPHSAPVFLPVFLEPNEIRTGTQLPSAPAMAGVDSSIPA
jgi:hypothetical protein